MKKQIIGNCVCILLTLLICQSALAQDFYPEAKRDEILKNIKAPAIPAFKIKLKKKGTKNDSITDNRKVFQQAFAKAKAKGGAHIIVPAGTYFINGPLHLESNICLELQKGARLKFTDNTDSYLPVVLTSWEGTFLYNYSPFIYAYQKENISIIGEGTIDGNAMKSFSTWKPNQKASLQLSRDYNHNSTPIKERIFGKGHFLRPHLVQFFECKNILVEGVTVTNSPFWCIHLVKSENATFRAINFIAKLVNNDGIDPEYSKNILIENINFNNGDDNVAIKAGRDTEGRATAIPSENIIIRNCKFKGLHGVVMGSEMSAGVQNIFVENCGVGGYLKRGIYLKSNPDRGGFIRNIYVKNVELGDVEDCFFITSFYHGEGTAGLITDIRDIFIQNVTCKKASYGGIVIQGFPGKPIKDIYLKNITIDDAKVPLSLTNTEEIRMSNVSIGGIVTAAPSTAQ
ncbi:MAG: glycoside hydrolase family 28 protein [Paludibacteraceae bacterium]|nr:glycoside hydrolase family 28 protein [Paludibacteraceae bacterium]MBN2787334.1 glycoside hydrolase family 28 protein [Paludibacteraceae bacterium]